MLEAASVESWACKVGLGREGSVLCDIDLDVLREAVMWAVVLRETVMAVA